MKSEHKYMMFMYNVESHLQVQPGSKSSKRSWHWQGYKNHENSFASEIIFSYREILETLGSLSLEMEWTFWVV